MIYIVSPIIQEKEIDEYCFHKCGKILFAGVDFGEFGPFLPCKIEKCPFEDKVTDIVGTVFNENACIRALKSLNQQDKE